MKNEKIYLTEEKYITKRELDKITVEQLENNIIGKTNGEMLISKINDIEIIWEYRKQDGIFNPVCDKENAEQITITTNNGRCVREIIL